MPLLDYDPVLAVTVLLVATVIGNLISGGTVAGDCDNVATEIGARRGIV